MKLEGAGRGVCRGGGRQRKGDGRTLRAHQSQQSSPVAPGRSWGIVELGVT